MITDDDVRIAGVWVTGPSTVDVKFRGSAKRFHVELAGWIATGGATLAPLRDPKVFERAAVSDHGAAVSWDDGEGDLSIDAFHLRKLVFEQMPFSNQALRAWQERVEISNAEAADFVGVSLSTWSTYRVDAAIPRSVALVLRAAERDPLLLQAHFRPRHAGRPRGEAAHMRGGFQVQVDQPRRK